MMRAQLFSLSVRMQENPNGDGDFLQGKQFVPGKVGPGGRDVLRFSADLKYPRDLPLACQGHTHDLLDGQGLGFCAAEQFEEGCVGCHGKRVVQETLFLAGRPGNERVCRGKRYGSSVP